METTTTQQSPVPAKKLGKFSASFLMAKECWRLLMKDKEVLLFPIVSSATLILLLAALISSLWLIMGPEALSALLESPEEELNQGAEAIYYVVLFVFYLVSAFVTTFFNVGLTAVVYARIKGGDFSFMDGINSALNIIGKIFTWSIITATVGVILQLISNRSKWVGKFVASLLGGAWNILTFFIAPTLLLDKVSVKDSIKNSGLIFKKTWGETLITGFSLGIFNVFLFMAVVLTFAVLGSVIAALELGVIAFIIFAILFLLSLLMLSVISTTLRAIYRVVLYEYAKDGILASGFTPELIYGSVKKGKVVATSNS
jgi:hypothetical protein